MSVKLPSFQKNTLWNNLCALLLHKADFRTFPQLIPRKTILLPNHRPFSNRITITRKHTEIHRNLHIMVTLTLFVRVRILLRLPPKKQLFVRKAAFFITFCSLCNFQIFRIRPFAPQFYQNMTICVRCDHITVMPLPVCRSVLSAGSAALLIKNAYVITFQIT